MDKQEEDIGEPTSRPDSSMSSKMERNRTAISTVARVSVKKSAVCTSEK